MKQANRNQRNRKGKMLLFDKIGKGCVFDKNKKVLVIEVT